jgi:hypothetical protein
VTHEGVERHLRFFAKQMRPISTTRRSLAIQRIIHPLLACEVQTSNGIQDIMWAATKPTVPFPLLQHRVSSLAGVSEPTVPFLDAYASRLSP